MRERQREREKEKECVHVCVCVCVCVCERERDRQTDRERVGGGARGVVTIVEGNAKLFEEVVAVCSEFLLSSLPQHDQDTPTFLQV